MDAASDKLAAALFEQVPCAVVVIDRDHQIVTANAAFQESYGDWEGRHCYEVFKRRHRPCERCAASLTFEDGKVHVTEEQGVDKEGRPTYFEVKTAPLHGPSGEVAYVLEMSVDITRYKALDRKYQLLFERVPCFVTVLDRDLHIVDANWRHRETFGDSRGELCHRVYMQSAESCASCPVRRTLEDGRVHSQQKEALDKRGETVHFLVHSAPIHDHRGQIVQVIEMATDITPMLEMQRKLLDAEGDAAMNKAMGMLTLTVGEILAGFEHGVSSLHQGLEDDDAAAAGQACARLRSRIAYLRSMHAVMQRFRSGEGPRGEVAAQELVSAVIRSVSKGAISSGTEVRGDVEQGLTIRGIDPDTIQECLVCLIHGFDDICVSERGPGSHHVVLTAGSRSEGGALLEVAYRGLAVAREPEGSGIESQGVTMGLAVVQRVVEAQGGRVTFTSPHGHGITFRIELP